MAKPYTKGQFKTNNVLYAAYLSMEEAAHVIDLARQELPDITLRFSKNIPPDDGVEKKVQKAVNGIVQDNCLAEGDKIENANLFEYNHDIWNPFHGYGHWTATFESDRPAIDLLNEGVHHIDMKVGDWLNGQLVAGMYVRDDEGPDIMVYDKVNPVKETELWRTANDYAIKFAKLLDETLPKEMEVSKSV